tara:strand:+ start:302 stop:766 length:465 start_codon:yes stop_codon:yes gene_type:complete
MLNNLLTIKQGIRLYKVIMPRLPIKRDIRSYNRLLIRRPSHIKRDIRLLVERQADRFLLSFSKVGHQQDLVPKLLPTCVVDILLTQHILLTQIEMHVVDILLTQRILLIEMLEEDILRVEEVHLLIRITQEEDTLLTHVSQAHIRITQEEDILL